MCAAIHLPFVTLRNELLGTKRQRKFECKVHTWHQGGQALVACARILGLSPHDGGFSASMLADVSHVVSPRGSADQFHAPQHG